jgi:beta-N-acetylhexosaminidase
MKGKYFLFLICLIFFCESGFATGEKGLPKGLNDPPFLTTNKRWVDSLMNCLSLEEKIGQLIMVDVYSGKDCKEVTRVSDIINLYKIGGIIFFKGTPLKQAELTNQYQSLSKVPLLVGMDAEWGLNMRLDSTIKYPYALSLGAIENNSLIYEMGKQVGEQLSRMGINVNFAPDIDINSNPLNPVINTRSFGENRLNVTLKGLAYMLGIQEKNVMAVGKHFPGHGDTNSDSHFGLPIISYSRDRLDSIELFPFKYLIQGGISGIMTGHLHLEKLDTCPGRPSSLSPSILNGILRKDLGFKGLVMTDAMNMKGMSNYSGLISLDVQALLAGNDLLVMPSDVKSAVDSIKEAVCRGLLSIEDIDSRCRRMLMAKSWAGLSHYKPIALEGLIKDLNKPEYELLNRKLSRELLTIVKNTNQSIPLKYLDTLRIASVTIGETPDSVYDQTLDLYASVHHFFINRADSEAIFNDLLPKLQSFNSILVTFTWSDLRANRQFGLKPQLINFIDSLCLVKPVILGLTANPYSLSYLKNRKYLKGIVVGYEDLPIIREMMAQLIFGGQPAHGTLPVSIDSFAREHDGIRIDSRIRLAYMLPEEIGICSDSLAAIDSIVQTAIEGEAFPGCQILASWQGVVFYYKSFGFHTYDTIEPVRNHDLFDLASVTKICSTLPSVMRLYEQGRINLKGKLSEFLPEAAETNKSKLLIQDILTHQAGLQAWIPFYTSTLKPILKGKALSSKVFSEEFPFRVDKNFYLCRQIGYLPGVYRSDSTRLYQNKVAEQMWINNSWRDTIFRKIYESPLNKKKEYLYSDLSFLLLWRMVEYQTGQPLQDYVMKQFYSSLGAVSMRFQPLRSFDRSRIVPTENDLFWRRQLVQGNVHDMGAAMLGGVAGHAGLFSDANDLAKMMQMYLNGGSYGGCQYFSSATINLYTTAPFISNNNRRGLGFDKPLLDLSKGPGSSCPEASGSSFGHTGFTGTMSWADPVNKLVYVFLSNRVYPTAENNKLSDYNIRPRIQAVFYHAIKSATMPLY